MEPLKTKFGHPATDGQKAVPTARQWRRVAKSLRRPIIILVDAEVKMKGFALLTSARIRPRCLGRGRQRLRLHSPEILPGHLFGFIDLQHG